jgi:RHH-type rel operon transcriptional repressor/antitoxin RelB
MRAVLKIDLTPELEQRLRSLAERTGRSEADWIREAVLRQVEDLEDEACALERLAKPERRWTLEELEREVDLERRVGRTGEKGASST